MSSDMKDTELEIILMDFGNRLLDVVNGKENPTLGELVDTPAGAIRTLIKRETDKAHQEGYKKGYVNAGIEALNG